LAEKPVQFRLDVYNYLIYHLERLENSKLAGELISELKTMKEEINDNL